jgi:uncharacterized membrane protein YcaP (DUF421 family)
MVDEGKIKQDSLIAYGLDDELIKDELKKQGYKNVSEVYDAEWVKDGGFYIKGYNKYIQSKKQMASNFLLVLI